MTIREMMRDMLNLTDILRLQSLRDCLYECHQPACNDWPYYGWSFNSEKKPTIEEVALNDEEKAFLSGCNKEMKNCKFQFKPLEEYNGRMMKILEPDLSNGGTISKVQIQDMDVLMYNGRKYLCKRDSEELCCGKCAFGKMVECPPIECSFHFLKELLS